MSSLTIAQIQQRQIKLQDSINALLNTFSDETGLTIDKLEYDGHFTGSHEPRYFVTVRLNSPF